tara:strand:- start:290 stop:916 length:627 start_codon:yes stop_codon:yes gene_type:complete
MSRRIKSLKGIIPSKGSIEHTVLSSARTDKKNDPSYNKCFIKNILQDIVEIQQLVGIASRYLENTGLSITGKINNYSSKSVVPNRFPYAYTQRENNNILNQRFNDGSLIDLLLEDTTCNTSEEVLLTQINHLMDPYNDEEVSYQNEAFLNIENTTISKSVKESLEAVAHNVLELQDSDKINNGRLLNLFLATTKQILKSIIINLERKI